MNFNMFLIYRQLNSKLHVKLNYLAYKRKFAGVSALLDDLLISQKF